MDIEKNFEFAELFSIYGDLLTPKQQEIMKDYFLFDLSLGEIAENYNISRSAVLDSLKKSKAYLLEIDSKLHLLEKNKVISNIINNKNLTANEIRDLLKGVE